MSRACLVESIGEEGLGSGEERLLVGNAELQEVTGFSRNTVRRAIRVLTNPRAPLLERLEAGGYIIVLPDSVPECLK